MTGNIRLLRSFDFETSSQHEIVVEAEDSGQPRLKNSMKLTILVHDVNDNAPVFDNSTYFARYFITLNNLIQTFHMKSAICKF
jgi:hypothetical protein